MKTGRLWLTVGTPDPAPLGLHLSREPPGNLSMSVASVSSPTMWGQSAIQPRDTDVYLPLPTRVTPTAQAPRRAPARTVTGPVLPSQGPGDARHLAGDHPLRGPHSRL